MRGSHAQVRGGGAAAVGGADGAPPETAGLPHCAGPGAMVAAALAAAELALAALLFLQASRLIILLSLSGRFLPRLGIMLAATTAGAAGVAVLQYKLVSTFPPTVGFEVYPPGGTAVPWEWDCPWVSGQRSRKGRDCCVQNSQFCKCIACQAKPGHTRGAGTLSTEGTGRGMQLVLP